MRTTASAVAAAQGMAAELNFAADDPVVLSEANNVIVWLRPSPVVARIFVNGHDETVAKRELVIAQWCSPTRSVIEPVAGIPPRVYHHDDLAMTFWRYTPRSPEPVSTGQALDVLLQLHKALATIPLRVPTLFQRLEQRQRKLVQCVDAGVLEMEDGEVIQAVSDWLARRCLKPISEHQIVHGDVHVGNWMNTDDGIKFLDFEAPFSAPVEWDLAFFDDEEVLARVPDVNLDKLRDIRGLVKAGVVIECAQHLMRKPEDQSPKEHIEFHMKDLRSRATELLEA